MTFVRVLSIIILYIYALVASSVIPPKENDWYVHTIISSNLNRTLYDAIIVGGGASGCTLARTLAEANKTVLLIERGSSRHVNPETLDMNGAGWVISNPDVSQLIITEEGIRSHVASVLSGGTAINMGIAIAETNEYFEDLNKLPGVNYNITKFNEALNWTIKTFASPWPKAQGVSHLWQQKLQHMFNKDKVDQKIPLNVNDTWRTYSLFNSKENFSRFAADHALINPPATLKILLNHTVHKIETFPKKNGKIRATCVIVKPTSAEDISPIVAPKASEEFSIAEHFKSLLKRLFSNHTEIPFQKKPYNARIPAGGLRYKICVNDNGIIVSSAGAILTPILMYKSGIGPKQFVKNAGVSPLVKEIPEIGSNLKDRVLIPISLLVKEDFVDNIHPSIGSTVALGLVGTNCSTTNLSDCSFAPLEELGGGHFSEGAMIATRMVVPAEIRNIAATDIAMSMYQDCRRSQSPLEHDWLQPMCRVQKHAASCFQRIVSFFYFTSEPKSLGELKVSPNGQISVHGHYLENPSDLLDAANGLSHLVQALNVKINTTENKMFESDGFNCVGIILTSRFLDAVGTRYEFLNRLRESQFYNITDMKESSDIYSKILPFKYLSQTLTWLAERKPSGFQFWIEFLKVFDFTRQFKDELTGIDYSSYPLQIPALDWKDIEGLKRYAKTWMTSIWHWTGSASMGVVVDSEFKVYGFENLHIVDASVLNKVTRMNPSITILSLGRYAGKILSEKKTSQV